MILISIHALLAESDVPFRGHDFWPRYFYPRSPCGERPNNVMPAYAACGISIHALLAESDVRYPWTPLTSTISIHALLAESDFYNATSNPANKLFLSTLSLRRATTSALPTIPDPTISIHALLAESDRQGADPCGQKRGISIHALLAESDLVHPSGYRLL